MTLDTDAGCVFGGMTVEGKHVNIFPIEPTGNKKLNNRLPLESAEPPQETQTWRAGRGGHAAARSAQTSQAMPPAIRCCLANGASEPDQPSACLHPPRASSPSAGIDLLCTCRGEERFSSVVFCKRNSSWVLRGSHPSHWPFDQQENVQVPSIMPRLLSPKTLVASFHKPLHRTPKGPSTQR